MTSKFMNFLILLVTLHAIRTHRMRWPSAFLYQSLNPCNLQLLLYYSVGKVEIVVHGSS
jgi:hypothetical protein